MHVTFLAHSLHIVTEDVRSIFLKLDARMSKMILVKAPVHKMQFKWMAPGVSKLLEPIVTRPRTCIDAKSVIIFW